MSFRKRLPIELDHDFICYIMYRYSKKPRLFIAPLKHPGVLKIKKGETYWLPEDYAIVNDSYIAYKHDYFSRNDFDWKPAAEMNKDLARFGVECQQIEKKKLKNLNKTELIKSGIAPGTFYCKDDEGITSEFKSRPIEFWRFRKRWEREFEKHAEWDESCEVLIFHFEICRFKPKLTIFGWHVEDKLNHQRRKLEFQINTLDEKLQKVCSKNKTKTKINKKKKKKKVE